MRPFSASFLLYEAVQRQPQFLGHAFDMSLQADVNTHVFGSENRMQTAVLPVRAIDEPSPEDVRVASLPLPGRCFHEREVRVVEAKVLTRRVP